MAGSSSSGGELRAPIFHGVKYDFWNVKMKTILKAHDLWHFVDEGFEDSDIDKDEEATRDGRLTLRENITKDAKALSLIQNAVSDEIFPRISNVETSKQAWDIIQQEYKGDKKVRYVKLQSLRRDFEYTRMRDDETLSAYLTRVFGVMNEMKTYGEDIHDKRMMLQ